MHPLSLLKILADGGFHSGSEMGEYLGLTRAAIWKGVHALNQYGIEVHSVKGKGYKLSDPIALIDSNVILQHMPKLESSSLQSLDVLFSVNSTNTHLSERLQVQSNYLESEKLAVCLAELQTAGRGRRGRAWVSPFGQNIYLSLAKKFSGGAEVLEGISLVAGLAVVRALEEFGVKGLSLKWPNDVLANNQKLCGVLLEMHGEYCGECQVIIGVGINVQPRDADMQEIEQAWTSVSKLVNTDGLINRNKIAALVISKLITLLAIFEKEGFAAFKDEWQSVDHFFGKQIQVHLNDSKTIFGVSKGVTDNGALKVLTDDGEKIFNGGELSLRLA